MATVNSKDFVDNIIKNNGFYNADDEDSPDNPRCIKIVEYTNMAGIRVWGLVFPHEDFHKYEVESPFIGNPETIWVYNKDKE